MFAIGLTENGNGISLEDVKKSIFTQEKAQPCPQTVNMCGDCDVEMMLSGSSYSCPECGMVDDQAAEDQKSKSDRGALGGVAHVKVKRGHFTYRYNIVNGSNSQQTKKDMAGYVWKKIKDSKNGIQLPQHIIYQAAETYYSIQENRRKAGSDFVHRASLRDEIIAAIIYFEASAANHPLRYRALAEAFGLPGGFARGISILRTEQFYGYSSLDTNMDVTCSLVAKYLTVLRLNDNPDNCKFVETLLEIAKNRKIGTNSSPGSQVAGAVYLLVHGLGIGLKTAELEAAFDGTKSATYMKFVNEVSKRWNHFHRLFLEYGLKWK